MASGAGDKAIATLEQIVQKDPLDGEALLLAGDYYSKNGQKEKAELRYQTAAGIQGFEAEAFVKHAQLLVQSQKYAPGRRTVAEGAEGQAARQRAALSGKGGTDGQERTFLLSGVTHPSQAPSPST